MPRATFQINTVSLTSGGPGSCLQIPRISGVNVHPNSLDTDSDGIPDEVEHIIGTHATMADSDGDGRLDLAEILQDEDPLGGRSLPTGIIASLELKGEVGGVHRRVGGYTRAADRHCRDRSTWSGHRGRIGVQSAHRVGELALPGDAQDVAVDPPSGMAVIAATQNLHFVDVSEPMLPRLRRTANVSATQVEMVDGVAYAAVGARIMAYDPVSGDLLDSLVVPETPT